MGTPAIEMTAEDKAAMPALKTRMDELKLTELEHKHVMEMFLSFIKDGTLHLVGLGYLNAFGSDYRHNGFSNAKPTPGHPCPYCGGTNTTRLFSPVIEVFQYPLTKGMPGFERQERAVKVTREWKLNDKRDRHGNSIPTRCELPVLVYTDECADCNAVFPYPSAAIAVSRHYNLGPIDRIKQEFDVTEPTERRNYAG